MKGQSFEGSQVVVIVTVGLLLGMAVGGLGGVGIASAQEATNSTPSDGGQEATNSTPSRSVIEFAQRLANASSKEKAQKVFKSHSKLAKKLAKAMEKSGIHNAMSLLKSGPKYAAKFYLPVGDTPLNNPDSDQNNSSDAPEIGAPKDPTESDGNWIPDIKPVKWAQDIIMAGFNAFKSAVAGLINDFNWLIVSLPAPGQPFDPLSWYPGVASLLGVGDGGGGNGTSSPSASANNLSVAASAAASNQNNSNPVPDSVRANLAVIAGPPGGGSGGGGGGDGKGGGGGGGKGGDGGGGFIDPHSGPLNLDGWWMVTWGIYAVLGMLCIIPLGIEGIVTWTRNDLTPRERGTRLREIGKGIGTIILLPVLVPAVLHFANMFAIGVAPSGQEFMSSLGNSGKLGLGLILAVPLLLTESTIILIALFVLFVQWVLMFFVVATGPIYVWGVKSNSDMTHSIGKFGWTAFWGLITLKAFQALWLRWLFSLPVNFGVGGLLSILAIIVGLAVAFIGLPIKGTEKILPRVVVSAGRATHEHTGGVDDVRSLISRRSDEEDPE